MAYNINGGIPCGTDTCTGSEHRPASACNSVYDIILNAIKEIKGDVANLDVIAKEATLLAKVAELKEALNSIDFTAIEQAIQGVEDVTAREATLIQGVGDIIKAVENIDFTDLENSIAEVKNAVVNIDFSALAKEETLTQGIASVESKMEEVGNKIDNIKLPEIDTTELAKEDTVNGIKDFLAHLALSSRSVDGVYGVSDGISIAHLYGNTSECLAVTEIRDKDTGWVANIGNFLSSLISLFPNCRYFELGCSDITTSIYTNVNQDTLPETTIVFRDLQRLKDIVYYGANSQLFNANVTIHVYGLKTSSQTANYYPSFHVPKVLFHDYERGSIRIGGSGAYFNTYQSYIYLGCKGDKTDTITLVCDSKAINRILNDVEIRNEACQNIRILYCEGLTEENMINHILKRLKQDEEMCGSGVTITLGATHLAKLTSEEAVALLDSLTNTYGYTFA